MAAHVEKFVEVRVVTTSGVYPESSFDQVQEKEPVSKVLMRADEKLHITSTTGWVLQLQPTFDLCDICNPSLTPSKGALAPAGLIIGPPLDGVYSDAMGSIAGGSIAGKRPHNPFVSQSATFDLSIAGLTSSDSVSSVLFRFGTNFGTQTSNGVCTSRCGAASVPEPGALALFAAGLGSLGFALSRKRRQAVRHR